LLSPASSLIPIGMQCSPHIVSTGATFYNGSTGRENGIAFSSGGFSWCPPSLPSPPHVTAWSLS
jgi:hypothetical protein